MSFSGVRESKEISKTFSNTFYIITKLKILCARPGRLGAVCPAEKTLLSLGTSMHQAHSSGCLVVTVSSQPRLTAWLKPATHCRPIRLSGLETPNWICRTVSSLCVTDPLGRQPSLTLWPRE